MPLYPRPASFTPLAIPFTFLVNSTPEQCVEQLKDKVKTTQSWDQVGIRGNWEQIDADIWRVYVQKISRWEDVRSVFYLKRADPQSTNVSGYSEGNRQVFVFGGLIAVIVAFLIAIFMIGSYRDWTWLEMPAIVFVILLINALFKRRDAMGFIRLLNAILVG
jgi:hypothetical protein